MEVLKSNKQYLRSIIVQIPRFTFHSHLNEVAIHRFLESTTTIPVPRVLYLEISPSNIISDPFVILEHLKGHCLCDVYKDMPTDIKKSVVQSVACLLKQFSDMTFNAIGTFLSASPEGIGVKVGHAVDVVEESQYVPPPSPAHARSIHHYLEERWSFFMTEQECRNPGNTFYLLFTSSFRAAMYKLPIPDMDTPAHIILYRLGAT